MSNLLTSVLDIHARASKDNIEVHTVDTNAWIVLDSQVDVLLDTETEVPVSGEVFLPQLVFLDLEPTFQNLFGLGPPDSAVNGDLFIPSDTKRSDGVAGLGEDWGLTSQRLQHL